MKATLRDTQANLAASSVAFSASAKSIAFSSSRETAFLIPTVILKMKHIAVLLGISAGALPWVKSMKGGDYGAS